jgi:aldose 1-epimerase
MICKGEGTAMSKRARGIAICAALVLGTGALAVRTSVARLSGQASQNPTIPPPVPSVPTAAPPPAQSSQSAQAAQPISIGDEPAVILTRPRSLDAAKPQFLQAVVLPGMGMNMLQVQAYLPGKGDIQLLSTMDLPEAKTFLETANDEFGNNAFKIGAAMLVPYPNRIRGRVSADGKTITAIVDGHRLSLPANWRGPEPGAESVAMNGLILTSKFQDVREHNGLQESTVFAMLHAGDFGGHWLSQTNVNIGMTLKDQSLDVYIIAKNIGDEEDPMALGFQPYFQIPSGDRKQVRLHVPADMRAIVNNYDDVFPTGRIVSVDGTAYDFTAPEGKALGDLTIDDCFTDLQNDPDHSATVELVDPAAKYGLRVRALSPHIRAIQVYAPPDKNFVAIEPQFNFADPYKRIWHGQDTGVVLLQPNHSAVWHVRIELFTPR